MTEWYTTASDAQWKDFAELKKTFNSADYVANGKVVFDIGGNKYRLVGLIGYRTQRIFVLFVGTYAEYDRIDVASRNDDAGSFDTPYLADRPGVSSRP